MIIFILLVFGVLAIGIAMQGDVSDAAIYFGGAVSFLILIFGLSYLKRK